MLHKMKLSTTPFNSIKNGYKTIEMRLNDEKRQLLQIGDIIEFTCVETNDTIFCKIENLFRYNNYSELYSNHSKESLGYFENEIPNPSDMLKYYSVENIQSYGVLAIKINLVKNEVLQNE